MGSCLSLSLRNCVSSITEDCMNGLAFPATFEIPASQLRTPSNASSIISGLLIEKRQHLFGFRW